MIEEQRLVTQAKAGDQRAFEALVNLHSARVYNLALRVLRGERDAQDVAQEAFIRAWRGLPQFQGTASFQTWLYRIVLNLCYTQLPKLKRELAQVVPEDAANDLADERQGVEATLLSSELMQFLHRAIDELPESYRLLVTLRHLQELSYNEIAEVTGMPLGTVKTGIFRARALLKQAIETYEAME